MNKHQKYSSILLLLKMFFKNIRLQRIFKLFLNSKILVKFQKILFFNFLLTEISSNLDFLKNLK
jgi:hypothetical protein